MSPRIFISYAFGDKAVADGLCILLKDRGIECWIAPRDIAAGQSFPEAIVGAIQQCPFLLLLFTSRSNVSRHVGTEVGIAFSGSRELLLLKMEEAEPSGTIRYYFHNSQWIDASPETLNECADKVAAVTGAERVAAATPLEPAWRPLAIEAVKEAEKLENVDVSSPVKRALAEVGVDTRQSEPRDTNSRLVWTEHLERLQGHDVPELCHLLRQPDTDWQTRFKAVCLMQHSLAAPAGAWLIPVGVPAAIAQLGLPELRGRVLDLIATLTAPAAQKWEWLMLALRLSSDRFFQDKALRMLPRVTAEEKRAESGAAVVNLLQSRGGSYEAFEALRDLDHRDAAPLLRSFVRRLDWATDAARLLAQWRDRESAAAMRSAIDSLLDQPHRTAEVRELAAALYRIEREDCAVYLADLLANSSRGVQTMLLTSESPFLELVPVVTVIRDLAVNSPAKDVRDACARLLKD